MFVSIWDLPGRPWSRRGWAQALTEPFSLVADTYTIPNLVQVCRNALVAALSRGPCSFACKQQAEEAWKTSCVANLCRPIAFGSGMPV